MSTNAELEIKWVPPERGSTTGTIVFQCGGESFIDRLNIENADRRVAIVNRLAEKWPALDTRERRSELVAELERIASKRVQSRIDREISGSDEDAQRKSQADSLVALAESAELFHTPEGNDSEAFATILVGDHRETWPLPSKGFRRWLARQFYLECEKAPSTQALVDAMNVLVGKALFEGSEYKVALRLAQSGGDVWLDLADAEWRAIRVTGNGWSVVPSTDVPIRFKRRRGRNRSRDGEPRFDEEPHTHHPAEDLTHKTVRTVQTVRIRVW